MGFISSKLKKDFKKRGDELIKGGVLVELIDGPALGIIINILDDQFSDKIPVKYQDEVIAVLEAFAYNDASKLTEATSSLIDEFVDLPFADSDETAKFILLNVQMIERFVRYLAKK